MRAAGDENKPKQTGELCAVAGRQTFDVQNCPAGVAPSGFDDNLTTASEKGERALARLSLEDIAIQFPPLVSI